MRAQAILGPGARESHLLLLRSIGLTIEARAEYRCDSDADLLIVLGGDGTVHRFLPELILCGTPVLVLPCGSGNDLARALCIRSVDDALSLAREFVRRNAMTTEIDTGVIVDSSGKETPFCCTAGVGIDAAAAQLANRMPRWLRAHGGYLISALAAIFINPTMELALSLREADSIREFAHTTCLFTIANTPSFGGGLPIAPDARLNDGQFDCVLADAMSQARLARASLSLLRGTHLKLREVNSMHASGVRVESNPRTAVYADGEFVCETPIDVRIHSRSLRVLSLAPH